MNYEHIYHAGNFADVAKHLGLLYCLDSLQRKETPFLVLDTHAGRGRYDLQAPEARKSGEGERGVQLLVQKAGAAQGGAVTGSRRTRAKDPGFATAGVLARYLTAIGARPGKRLAVYPGSAALIAAALRPQDRAVFVELMPAEARALLREVGSAGRLKTLIEDGYAVLKASVPPPERRGLVLIDPPYESLDEFKTLLQAFADAHRRWPSGTYLMWYPIRSAAQRRQVHSRFEALGIPKLLYADLAIHPDDAGVGLAGSGLMIANPPYGADEFLAEAYGRLHELIGTPAMGYVEVARLTPERVAS